MTKQKIFTRTIWTLSLVSLFNDISSEMLYPIMPIYLSSIGFTALWIGILEGVAEVVVGLSKGYFGKLSDEKGKRLPYPGAHPVYEKKYFLHDWKPAVIQRLDSLFCRFCRLPDDN